MIADRSEEALQETKRLILELRPETEVVVAVTDVTSQEQVKNMLESTVSSFGRVDYAVNAAGILGASKRSHEMSVAEFDNVVQVDYRGCWLCSREELKHMVDQEPLNSHDGRPGNRGCDSISPNIQKSHCC